MKIKTLDPQALEGVSRIFKALCEPIRLRILQELQESERTVSDLCAAVGTSQPNLSKHLKLLVDAHLLRRRQEGNSAYYSIADPMVHQLCEMICKGIQKRLDQQVRIYSSAHRAPRKSRAS
ncbi:MAG: metalloregulator ArsR/SmtB family transcription factor [Deltaproteobacteria bacterium]|nr:metalloregulator ArsR/SmtB family transcription factor [Deltaproteobacteria bacterium]